MATLLNDVRFALRSMAKSPGSSLLLILTLAVGLAANGIVFNILDAMVLRGFEFPNSGNLVRVWETGPDVDGIDRDNVAPANFLDWKEQGRASLAGMIALDPWEGNLRGDTAPERLEACLVGPGFFEALGVPPALGRSFVADDAQPGHDRRVILGDALWHRAFGGAPMLGRSVTIDGQAYEVVGIARRGFQFPDGADAWIPLVLPPAGEAPRDRHHLSVLGRLADGRGLEAVRAELGVVAQRLATEHPRTNTARGVQVASFNLGFGDPVLPQILVIWQAAAVLVLLIACMNAANLILARGAERRRELALRLALGAGRGRIVRQLLTEGALVALFAAVVSMPLVALGARAVRDNMPAEVLRYLTGWENLGADWRTLAFSGALAILAAALVSAQPAFRASRADLQEVLHDGGRSATAGRGRQRGRNALVVVQLSAALVLVATAGLAVSSALRLLRGPQGYDPEGLLTFAASLPEKDYADSEKSLAFVRDLKARLSALPGVTGIAVANVLPARNGNSWRGVEIEGQPLPKNADAPSVDARWIEPEYFQVMRQPLLRGRGIEASDGPETPRVAVVSASFAERFWPGQDPIGRRFRTLTQDGQGPWLAVVGVAGDVIHQWVMRRNHPTMYVPMRQEPRTRLAFAVRTSGDPDSLARSVPGLVASIDPDQPADDVMSMHHAIRRSTIGMQYVAGVMSAFGLLALVLAISGVYGVLSYRISLRTAEIGVRMALGATRRDVLSLTLGQALRLSAVGLGAGAVLAFGMGRMLSAALRGAVASDPLLLATATLALGLAALLAALGPARRAMAVDPATALRAE
jgi:putative ABC transport system permease protein